MVVLERYEIETPWGTVYVDGESYGDPITGEPERDILYWELYADKEREIYIGYLGNHCYTKLEYMRNDIISLINKRKLQSKFGKGSK